jgi:hypothetical protein
MRRFIIVAVMLGVILRMSFTAAAQADVTAKIVLTSKTPNQNGTVTYCWRSDSTDTSNPNYPTDSTPKKDEWDPDTHGESSFTPAAEGHTYCVTETGPKQIDVGLRSTGYDNQKSHVADDQEQVPSPADSSQDILTNVPSQLDLPNTTVSMSSCKPNRTAEWSAGQHGGIALQLVSEALGDGCRKVSTYRIPAFPANLVPGPIRIDFRAWADNPNNAQDVPVTSQVRSVVLLTDFRKPVPVLTRTKSRLTVQPIWQFMASADYRWQVSGVVRAKFGKHWQQVKKIKPHLTSGTPDFGNGQTVGTTPIKIKLAKKFRKRKLQVRLKWFVQTGTVRRTATKTVFAGRP